MSGFHDPFCASINLRTRISQISHPEVSSNWLALWCLWKSLCHRAKKILINQAIFWQNVFSNIFYLKSHLTTFWTMKPRFVIVGKQKIWKLKHCFKQILSHNDHFVLRTRYFYTWVLCSYISRFKVLKFNLELQTFWRQIKESKRKNRQALIHLSVIRGVKNWLLTKKKTSVGIKLFHCQSFTITVWFLL